MVFSEPSAARRNASSAFRTARIIAARAQICQFLFLFLLRRLVDLQQIYRLVFGLETVRPDHDTLFFFHFALITIACARNLALRESHFDGGNHPAQLVDTIDVLVTRAFHL